jgi:hypothetical protein
MGRFREHRLVDGVPSFRCPKCRHWKNKGDFFTNATPAKADKLCGACRAKVDGEARA